MSQPSRLPLVIDLISSSSSSSSRSRSSSPPSSNLSFFIVPDKMPATPKSPSPKWKPVPRQRRPIRLRPKPAVHMDADEEPPPPPSSPSEVYLSEGSEDDGGVMHDFHVDADAEDGYSSGPPSPPRRRRRRPKRLAAPRCFLDALTAAHVEVIGGKAGLYMRKTIDEIGEGFYCREESVSEEDVRKQNEKQKVLDVIEISDDSDDEDYQAPVVVRFKERDRPRGRVVEWSDSEEEDVGIRRRRKVGGDAGWKRRVEQQQQQQQKQQRQQAVNIDTSDTVGLVSPVKRRRVEQDNGIDLEQDYDSGPWVGDL